MSMLGGSVASTATTAAGMLFGRLAAVVAALAETMRVDVGIASSVPLTSLSSERQHHDR
jgi:hypothetical protein